MYSFFRRVGMGREVMSTDLSATKLTLQFLEYPLVSQDLMFRLLGKVENYSEMDKFNI